MDALAKKKEQRNQRILRTAETLFLEKGYKKTIMSEIASDSSLAVGTLYNYYRNKGEILIAILERKVKQSFYEKYTIEDFIDKKSRDSVYLLLEAYVDIVQTIDKELWKSYISENVSIEYNMSLGGYKYVFGDLIVQLRNLTHSLQEIQVIKKEVDLIQCNHAINFLFYMNLLFYVATQDSLGDFKSNLCAQIELLFSGIGKDKTV